MLPPTYVEGFHDLEAVKAMKYNPLGKTGMLVSHLSIGGGALGGFYGEYEEADAIAAVQEAIRKGVNYIDTAPWYGDGRSEALLGKALAGVPRKAYYLATKVGRYKPITEEMFDFSAKRALSSVDKSLDLLKLSYVDIIQVHDVEFAPSLDLIVNETLPALESVVKAGKAHHIGITGYSVNILKDQRVIIRFLHLRGETPIEIHRQMSETCGQGVMDIKNVRSWVRKFKEGRESCDDEVKEPRPRTSRTETMIARVEKVVTEDPRISVRGIASKVGISVGSVETILHDELKMRKSKGVGVINAALTAMGLLTNGGPPDWHPASKDIKEVCAKAAEYCKKSGVEIGRLAVYYALNEVEGPATHLVGINSREITTSNLSLAIGNKAGENAQPFTDLNESCLRKLVL
ncbi:hypothetical protein J437_LFUL014806 [Ladona fulva]|uniref:L-galactose dehydrogenase n=1 Tax=Ladona fulva TaxID=123851 RepID=A0A8K0KHD1_LADFU|nr:hypothetical protein J437_LFUL014806 [Ladona fulva]